MRAWTRRRLSARWMRVGLVSLAFGFSAPVSALVGQTTSYEVDLNDRADDRFKVTVHLQGLTAADSIFQFAATAPGTYQVMDIGRYVSDFRAYDGSGREIPTRRGSIDQWTFSEPRRSSSR